MFPFWLSPSHNVTQFGKALQEDLEKRYREIWESVTDKITDSVTYEDLGKRFKQVKKALQEMDYRQKPYKKIKALHNKRVTGRLQKGLQEESVTGRVFSRKLKKGVTGKIISKSLVRRRKSITGRLANPLQADH